MKNEFFFMKFIRRIYIYHILYFQNKWKHFSINHLLHVHIHSMPISYKKYIYWFSFFIQFCAGVNLTYGYILKDFCMCKKNAYNSRENINSIDSCNLCGFWGFGNIICYIDLACAFKNKKYLPYFLRTRHNRRIIHVKRVL